MNILTSFSACFVLFNCAISISRASKNQASASSVPGHVGGTSGTSLVVDHQWRIPEGSKIQIQKILRNGTIGSYMVSGNLSFGSVLLSWAPHGHVVVILNELDHFHARLEPVGDAIERQKKYHHKYRCHILRPGLPTLEVTLKCHGRLGEVPRVVFEGPSLAFTAYGALETARILGVD